MAKQNGETKAQWLEREIATAVDAGKTAALETVDFSDPDRPLTCLEVDFPILPVNQVAAIEGNAGKPIYQVSKWWARRRSSVFRSMLIAAAAKAPDDPAEADERVWDSYYKNHQRRGTFSDLKVADIFMGGGTTIVEGSRLGMQMHGTDLNPVAWFVVKTEMAQVERIDIERLLEDVEAEVKPQIMPFYATNCPRGHKGKWTRVADGEVMGDDFDPLALTPEERPAYSYEGPELIYSFWAKHGPCQVTGCGHRTPIITNPVMAVKTISVKAWDHRCSGCGDRYDIEEQDARMAPAASLVVAETEKPFAVMGRRLDVHCPLCGHHETMPGRGTAKKKKIELSLLVHPSWLTGESSTGPDGRPFGGSVTDSATATAGWNRARARRMRLVEVRGALPDEVTCPETNTTFKTGKGGGTVPKTGHFSCGACGTVQRIVSSLASSKRTAAVAAFTLQGFCPACKESKEAYGGRFFAAGCDATAFNQAHEEWESRRDLDLAGLWPESEVPFGHMTHQRQPLPAHGYLRWIDMFNPRQLLVQTQLLRAVLDSGQHSWTTREAVLAVFQQYLRNQNMFCFWNPQRDTPEPMFSNANFHPKSTVIENCVFAGFGRGNWQSSSAGLLKAIDWAQKPWELLSNGRLSQEHPLIKDDLKGKSSKVNPGDPVLNSVTLECGSATQMTSTSDESIDLVITDPPFGGLLHYSELSDFFYVWLRLALKDKYPEIFGGKYTPKTLEAVANRAREPEDPDGYYQRLLTAAWREAHRILKPGGLLSFTFHHSEDAPWVAVLESLFDAGFYLQATYPIRSDEIKGSGEFGSKTIEFDIIHVCRKRREDPKAVSWAKMRREVLKDVHRLKGLLEEHKQEGLPEADLQVIRRGKALEYYSRHYGQVFVDEDVPMGVKDALLGINQLLEEDAGQVAEPPPAIAAPFTRQFLRLFSGKTTLPQSEAINFLRGTGYSPEAFVERGWCSHDRKAKVYNLVPHLEIARTWHGKHRQGMQLDYDQAAFLMGACIEGSGINATETLSNTRFKPHPALSSLLEWFGSHGPTQEIRFSAGTAARILRGWQARNQKKDHQMSLFFGEEGAS